ncbi:MAG: hypothetical protein QME78_07585 [Thermodesulfobacteriota bacterium]|nr:hypothetical protein [Thermodesulfobacteriota bacterium]
MANKRASSVSPMQTSVENPLMAIESFNRQFQIGEKEREAVKWGWEQEMGKTMFHLVNAYTQAAQFEGLICVLCGE